MAKWIRRRFPEPKIEGSSPSRDGEIGLVGYDDCLTRSRSRVRSPDLVFSLSSFFELIDFKC